MKAANASMPSGRLNPLNDFLFLKIMGEKGDEPQLLGFLNAVLGRSGYSWFASVKIIENKSLSADFIGNKTSILDLRARLNGKSKASMEVQLRSQAYFDKRVLFSWSKAYTEGFKKGRSYEELPPVISVNILDFEFPPNEGFYEYYQLRGGFNPSRVMSRAMEIHCIDMTKWRRLGTIDIEHDPLHRWLAWLDQKSPPELIKEAISMHKAIRAADERLEHVSLDEESRDLYRRRQMALMDQAGYNDGIAASRREGIEIGREEGIEIGEEIGREKGKKEGWKQGKKQGKKKDREESVKNLHAYGMAAEQIALALKMPLETVNKILYSK